MTPLMYLSFCIMPTQFPPLVVQFVISSSSPSRIPIPVSCRHCNLSFLYISASSHPLPVMTPIFTGPTPNAQHHTTTRLYRPFPLDAVLSNRTGSTGTLLANSIRGSRLWLGPWPPTDLQLYCHKTFFFHRPSMQHVILYVFLFFYILKINKICRYSNEKGELN